MLISLAEYAAKVGRAPVSVRQMARNGGFKTAQKIGRDWLIDAAEPYQDRRVKSGKYIGQRQKQTQSGTADTAEKGGSR